MAVTTFTGSLAVPAATGNVAYTGVGFRPKWIFFFGNGRTSDGVTLGGTTRALWWGAAVSSTQRCVVMQGDNGAAAGAASDGTKCVKRLLGAATVDFAADMVTMDADGFTLNWTTANATAMIVNYIAFFGSGNDLTNASIISLTSPTATGNQATTGAGFKPDFAMFMGADAGASNTSANLGWAVSTSKRGCVGVSNGSVDSAGGQTTTKCYSNIDGSTVRCEADLVTFDNDGVTLNWTTANATQHTVYVLCLKGGSFDVGTTTQKTSTGTQAKTGLGFTPKGLIFMTDRSTTTGSFQPMQMNLGCATDSTHRASVNFDSFVHGHGSLSRTKVYQAYEDDTTPTLDSEADYSSSDADGYTLNYTTADAVARQILYFAIGNAAAAAFYVDPPKGSHRPGPFLPGTIIRRM